ncbi:MAG: hypothetical protein K6G03_08250 [Lachnospiraceae bacterium]|nr:hypothetical protein [Lachnospiraceae bacterium]
MNKIWKNPSKGVLTVRLLIGAYLLYIDYDIFDDVMAREGSSKIIMIAAMVLFAAAGLWLVAMSIKGLMGVDEQGSAEDNKTENDNLENDSEKQDG